MSDPDVLELCTVHRRALVSTTADGR